MAMNEAGPAYRPSSITPGVQFPLSVAEAAALENDIEMEMATDTQLLAAGIVICHSPYGQPSVCSRDWRTYTSLLAVLGLSIDDGRPMWRDDVRNALRPFRRAVGAASTVDLVAAE
jgi:hypothetical protein